MTKFSLIALTVLAVILAACGPSAASPTTTPAALGDFPTDNYTNTVFAWSLDLKADGSYSAGGPQVIENGIFTVAGDQISFKGSYCGNASGMYTWTYDGTALKFQTIRDECTERSAVVASGNWVKRP